MRGMIKGAKFAGLTAVTALLMSATAHAGAIYEPEASLKDPAPEARRCSLSANVALTTDYVFRGFTQTDENAAVQGGFDAECGMFYAGVWASNLDFGGDTTISGDSNDFANIEIDYYAGVKAEIPGTPVSVDLGAIYYTYPNAWDDRTYLDLTGAAITTTEFDYWEIKLGLSANLMPNLSTGLTVYYSPDYFAETGENWVIEGTAEYTLPQVAIFTPAISGTIGYQDGDVADGGFDYYYYNAGISLGFLEKFSLDVRYWNTDIQTAGTPSCSGVCDERIVGTLSASF